MQRRDFLKTTLLGAAALAAGQADFLRAESETAALAKKLPRWKGFNLDAKFFADGDRPFLETDFQWISDWGFDFIRLPMDYRCWTDKKDPYKLDDKVLGEIDQAVEWGKKYGVHVDLNLHRAPGYTVASPKEKMNLWKDEEAQKQFDFQWSAFAKRYRGIPAKQLSFDLVNEPANVKAEPYAKVVRRVVEAIRRIDPDRLIVADGLQYGRDPVFDLADLGIAQSTRGYDPIQVSHHGAPWVGGDKWPVPAWPFKEDKRTVDRKTLFDERIKPWKALAEKGVGIHVGECGAFSKTPHDVALAWMGDLLDLWKDAGWGFALWNFRGSFGILDSNRDDVAYEDFHGHKLDRKYLDLLRKSC
jgi:endoglucanase